MSPGPDMITERQEWRGTERNNEHDSNGVQLDFWNGTWKLTILMIKSTLPVRA